MKKRIVSAVIAVLYVAVMSLSAFCAQAKRTVRVGFFEMEGFFEKSQSGEYSGYGYDYIVEMAKYENWNLEFVEGTFEELQYMMADDKTVDMLAGIYHYDEYEEFFSYSDLSIGTGKTLLTAKSDNDALTYENFALLNGKRIGFLSDRYKCDEFQQLAAEKGFSYTEVMYQTSERLYEALDSGDVDAIAANDVFVSENEKLIASFYYRDYYIITVKDNPLMTEINDSLAKITSHRPQFQSDLYIKYYIRSDNGEPKLDVADYLTDEEKKFAQESEPFTVGISKYLMTNDEDGTDSCLAASIKQVYENIAVQSGLKFIFRTVSDTDEAIALANSGEIDIIAVFPEKVSLAEENNITLTNSFMTMYFDMVCNKNIAVGENPVMSLRRGFYFNNALLRENPDASVLYEDTYRGMIEAVDSGRAEVAVMNRYIAEELLAVNDFNNVYSVSSSYSENVSGGISKNNSPLLISIISKSIACISATEIAEIIEDNRAPYHSGITLSSFISTHPLLSVVVTAAFVLTVMAFVLIIGRQHKMKLSQKICDQLTGLYNTSGFLRNAQKIIDSNPKSSFALSAVNIRSFNYLTGVLGLEKSNDILKTVAETLSGAIPEPYLAARGEGSSFIVLYECLSDTCADAFAEKIQQKLNSKEHNNKEDYTIQIYCGSVMIGIDRPQLTLRELLDQAVTAQTSIRNKKDRNVFFRDAMLEAEDRMRRLVKQFSDAIESREFHIFLQPVHSLTDREKITGAELLTRWIKPDHSLVYPDEFINSLVSCNAIVRFDEYVMDCACEFLEENKSAAWMDGFTLSVNISNVSALQPGFAEYCEALKTKYNLPEKKISLEFSESVVFSDIVHFQSLFSALRKSGYICTIDNFGSGNASLRKLGELGADAIKLDHSLFRASDERTEQRNDAVSASILSVASSCGVSSTAIGIDRVSQLRFLRDSGCAQVQGYIYAKPMESERFVSYAEHFKPAFSEQLLPQKNHIYAVKTKSGTKRSKADNQPENAG